MSEGSNPLGFRDDEHATRRGKTLSEQAYLLIRRDILAGNLAPGTKLKVDALRARYNIGPTPIREALERLSAEQLARAEQQRGFRVSPMTDVDLIELADMLLLLETEALRRSLVAGDYTWEGTIVSAFHMLDRLQTLKLSGAAPDPEEWERRNSEFHNALIAAAGSGWLARSRAHIDDHLGRFRRCYRNALATADRDCHEEHRAIMEAALARNSDRATQLTQLHIKASIDIIRSALQSRLSDRSANV